MNDASKPTAFVSEGVEEGHDDQVSVAGTKPDALSPDIKDFEVLAMRSHYGLGATGCAGGEDKVGEVVRRDGVRSGLRVFGRHRCTAGQEVVPGFAIRALAVD